MNFWAKVLERAKRNNAKPDEDDVENLLNQIYELTGDGINAINSGRLADAGIALSLIKDARNAIWQTYNEAKNDS